ncbi:hypothetical protein [Paenibacillus spongiae]|uniref:SWIM-type domain-containing protein n=1 Tax=Paenibacillus spongiae TaxID=2909671 RepID=A0ABY5S3V4_9BACL|nr:hypothetical protein [Paenibacillus spongiae]UVI28591.1 hypothetical protein L1F29_24535 [Paenibacillus spongiae]
MDTYFRLKDGLRKTMEQQLLVTIPLPLLERGWDYYRREKVLSVQVMDGSSIYGTVRDSEIYAVTLDADEFGFSTCTCSSSSHCMHMAAVYYAYCDYAGESADEVHNRFLYGGDLATVEKSASGQDAHADGSPLEEKPDRWLTEMDRQHGEVWRQCRHSLHPLQAVLSAIKGTSKDWNSDVKRLHWMHAVLFVVDQAEKAYAATDSYSRYYYEMAFARMTEPWVSHYQEMAAELSPGQMTDIENAAVDSLVGLFHGRDMDREQQLHRWESLYFSLWTKLVTVPQRRLAEESWLKEANEAGRSAFFYPMALAFLAFIDLRDEEAVALLRDTAFNRTSLLACDCAMQRLGEGDWKRLESWMGFIHSGLKIERKSRSFGPFLSMCRLADERQPDNPQWQRYLISFLPHSYSALTEHWLGRQQYEQWADLQMLIGIDPGELDVQVLRELSKAAPHVLMPLYHQAIDAAIRSRNRQGYKSAVKLMKKLERLYKAENQQERWSRYIDGIVSKHQRLRALQEELWRGKIIT